MAKNNKKLTSKRNFIWPILAIVACLSVTAIVITLIVTGGSNAVKETKAPVSETPTATPTPAPEENGGKNIKGNTPRGTIEENQAKLLQYSQILLNQAYSSANKNNNFNDVLSAILKNDRSALSKNYQEKFRFTSIFENDTELQNISFVILAQLSKTIVDTYGVESITPLYDDASDNIYVDLEAGVAQVPFGVFAGNQASFSLEWVYVDGEWKFSPYTLVDAVQTAEQASGGLTSTPSTE